MRTCKVDEEQLAYWVDKARGRILYLGPAISKCIALKISEAGKRTGHCNHVVIDLDHKNELRGYGEISGIKILHNGNTNVQNLTGLRLAVLIAPDVGVVWSPIADSVDPREQVSVNGIWMEGEERRELLCCMSRIIGKKQSLLGAVSTDYELISHGHNYPVNNSEATVSENPKTRNYEEQQDSNPSEPDVQVSDINEESIDSELDKLNNTLKELEEENKTEKFRRHIGFIEIHVTGASLSKQTTVSVPKELIELGLEDNLRNRLSEKMRIDLRDKVDLGARDVNHLVDTFKEEFTQQLRRPLGRMFKKSEWNIMEKKLKEINEFVDIANDKIKGNLRTAVSNMIREISENWVKAIEKNPNKELQRLYPKDKIYKLLEKNWDIKKRATKMEVKISKKDLTSETLKEYESMICDAYPEYFKDKCSYLVYKA
ncbi:MAG: hypothetical protein OXE78_12150 [Gammaproteobacteria bacterium]|nr:hypothetical protein [Gammaproteobacteria bacterium]